MDPDDIATKWIKKLKHCHVRPEKEIQEQVRDILRRFPKLTGQGGNRSGADPFVIATAVVGRAIVVTGEDKGGPSSPKIPYVCEQLGIRCVKFTELLQIEGWKFVKA